MCIVDHYVTYFLVQRFEHSKSYSTYLLHNGKREVIEMPPVTLELNAPPVAL